ncbi:MAG: hypothetical protein ACI8W3_002221 [Myxococcota bacterium]|jgi:hypothetical protein
MSVISSVSGQSLSPQDSHCRHPTSRNARAYPASEVLRVGGKAEESFAGIEVEVGYDQARTEFSVVAPDEAEIIEGYWFAWMAFHPGSSVFVAEPVAGK